MTLLLLPLWYQLSLVFVFGLIIGSFLNVVVYRFNTGRSLNGYSHCTSCGTRLRWFELVPLLSYVLQLGRCRSCSATVSARYFTGELLTAVLFMLTYLNVPEVKLLLPVMALVATLVVIFFYDINHLIIPDQLVVVVSVLAVIVTLLTTVDVATLATHAAGALGTFLFFGGLWYVSAGRWIGLGDAKLAAPLALIVGPVGAFSLIALAFWVGTIVSLSVIAVMAVLTRGQTYLRMRGIRFTIKREVPFAPFIIVSFLIVYLFSVDVLTLVERALT